MFAERGAIIRLLRVNRMGASGRGRPDGFGSGANAQTDCPVRRLRPQITPVVMTPSESVKYDKVARIDPGHCPSGRLPLARSLASLNRNPTDVALHPVVKAL